MHAAIAERITQAVELVASDDQLLWCSQRIRDLEKRGSKATIRLTWKTAGGRIQYTVQVCRADGTLEDPPEVF